MRNETSQDQEDDKESHVKEEVACANPYGKGKKGFIESSEKVALRRSKYFFDHSKARFTANSKLALQAQTLNLRPFRFAKKWLPKKS